MLNVSKPPFLVAAENWYRKMFKICVGFNKILNVNHRGGYRPRQTFAKEYQNYGKIKGGE